MFSSLTQVPDHFSYPSRSGCFQAGAFGKINTGHYKHALPGIAGFSVGEDVSVTLLDSTRVGLRGALLPLADAFGFGVCVIW